MYVSFLLNFVRRFCDLKWVEEIVFEVFFVFKILCFFEMYFMDFIIKVFYVRVIDKIRYKVVKN